MKARKLAKKLTQLGRKRDAGEREPSGRLSRAAKKATEAKTVNEIRRLRDAAILGMRDPMWGTELGRLFLRNHIDARQFEAGKRWRNLVAAWRKTQEGPSITETSGLAILFDETRGRGRDLTDDPDVVKRTIDLGRELKAALDVLRSGNPRTAHASCATVRACCELDHPVIGVAEIARLKGGLDALGEHWRIV